MILYMELQPYLWLRDKVSIFSHDPFAKTFASQLEWPNFSETVGIYLGLAEKMADIGQAQTML
jgi:hypothetical protein